MGGEYEGFVIQYMATPGYFRAPGPKEEESQYPLGKVVECFASETCSGDKVGLGKKQCSEGNEDFLCGFRPAGYGRNGVKETCGGDLKRRCRSLLSFSCSCE